MDPKLKAYAVKQVVDMVTRDESISGDLRKIITDLMGADPKTLKHRVVDLDEAGWGGCVDFLTGESSCDYVTVIDANGRTRHLIFL